MPSRAGSNDHDDKVGLAQPAGKSGQGLDPRRPPTPSSAVESGGFHPVERLLAWLLGAQGEAALPVRVYYKFDSGAWRSRRTHQLRKVYRCR